MYGSFSFGADTNKNGQIARSLTDLIGNTPMLNMVSYCKSMQINSEIIAKLEYFNPLGSAKDRVGAALIENAEKTGEIKKGTVIIEPTSGNTGIGLAFCATAKGYKLILTMPENMSKERILMLKALGAEIVLTPANEGMDGAIKKAYELKAQFEYAYIPDQFNNLANADIHRKTTGPEILKDTEGKIDYFICGVGTGGSITGIGETLKAFDSNIKIIAVEPASSNVLSGGKKGKHGLMGIGAGFVPSVLNREIIDDVIPVTEEEAYIASRKAAKTEGLLIGISSGAVLHAATKIALENGDKNLRIVTFFPDSGERYFSTPLYK